MREFCCRTWRLLSGWESSGKWSGWSPSARRPFRRACALLAAFPTSFFYSMPYPESFGFLLVSGATLAWVPPLAGRGLRQSGARLSGAAIGRDVRRRDTARSGGRTPGLRPASAPLGVDCVSDGGGIVSGLLGVPCRALQRLADSHPRPALGPAIAGPVHLAETFWRA